MMKPETLSGLTSTPLALNISLTLSMASSSGPFFGAALPPCSPSKIGSLMPSPLPR